MSRAPFNDEETTKTARIGIRTISVAFGNSYQRIVFHYAQAGTALRQNNYRVEVSYWLRGRPVNEAFYSRCGFQMAIESNPSKSMRPFHLNYCHAIPWIRVVPHPLKAMSRLLKLNKALL